MQEPILRLWYDCDLYVIYHFSPLTVFLLQTPPLRFGWTVLTAVAVLRPCCRAVTVVLGSTAVTTPKTWPWSVHPFPQIVCDRI